MPLVPPGKPFLQPVSLQTHVAHPFHVVFPLESGPYDVTFLYFEEINLKFLGPVK